MAEEKLHAADGNTLVKKGPVLN